MIVIGQAVVDWVSHQLSQSGDYGRAVGFGIERNGHLCAGVVFNNYNTASIQMHVASDGSRRWLSRTFLWMVFDYAFNQAKVGRITGLVARNNVTAQRFDEHIGFTFETTLKDADPSGDLLVYRMFRSDCKWLNMKRPQNESIHEKRMAMAA